MFYFFNPSFPSPLLRPAFFILLDHYYPFLPNHHPSTLWAGAVAPPSRSAWPRTEGLTVEPPSTKLARWRRLEESTGIAFSRTLPASSPVRDNKGPWWNHRTCVFVCVCVCICGTVPGDVKTLLISIETGCFTSNLFYCFFCFVFSAIEHWGERKHSRCLIAVYILKRWTGDTLIRAGMVSLQYICILLIILLL